MKKIIIIAWLMCWIVSSVSGQERVEPIPMGNFDQWITRNIKESKAIGGNSTTIYAIGSQKIINGQIPIQDINTSPWGTSNVMASMMGITKTSNTTFPEERADGMCVRMETKMLTCRVIGLFNISVTISGAIYLGKANEPISGANNPYGKVDMGIPFTKRPKALEFDYRTKISPDRVITKSTMTSTKTYAGDDCADAFVYLQKRWEDENGNIYAKRVGTARQQFGKTTLVWQNNHRIPIHYGNITKEPFFRSYMGLRNDLCAKNSKGKIVPIQEVEWAAEDETPTHMVLMMCAGSLGAYQGALGNSFWVDNVELVY